MTMSLSPGAALQAQALHFERVSTFRCAANRKTFTPCMFQHLKKNHSSSFPNSPVQASAAPENPSSGASASPQVPAKKTITRLSKTSPGDAVPGPEAVRRVEEEGVAVEGVARVDRGGADITPLLKLAALAGGDVASLILFTWIGRATHVSTAVDWELLKSADPFIAGWAIAGYITKDFFPDTPPPAGLQSAASRALKTWALGAPLGIVIRGISKGQVPPGSFIGVTMASTLVILLSWRLAFAALTGGNSTQDKPGTKQGNPFEFFELLASLVKRW